MEKRIALEKRGQEEDQVSEILIIYPANFHINIMFYAS